MKTVCGLCRSTNISQTIQSRIRYKILSRVVRREMYRSVSGIVERLLDVHTGRVVERDL